MAEEFALRQAFAHSTAMHGNESEPAALLVESVNGARENLFSCSGFALQEHGGVTYLGCFVSALQRGYHARTGGDKAQARKDLANLFGIWYRLGHCLSTVRQDVIYKR